MLVQLLEKITFRDTAGIKGPGWKLKGRVGGLNFTLSDENSEPAASVGRDPVPHPGAPDPPGCRLLLWEPGKGPGHP